MAFDRGAAEQLARAAELPFPLAAVLAGRGLSDPAAARQFLNPRLSDLSDPFELPGMHAAVDRLWRAIGAGERVAVYGDYDVDGLTGTALAVSVLRRLGAQAVPFLPNRLEEGYGMSLDAFGRCVQQHGPGVVLTVDCGTGSVAAVAEAKRQGIDVVVTDHHEPAGAAAPAAAIVNPKLGGGERTQALAGVGVAFKLCHALLKRGRDAGAEAARRVELLDWLDLVAVGTVADVVPLAGENRTLVRHGLLRLNSAPRLGLKALMETARLKPPVNGYHVGFVIGPRLNAAGRLGSAESALSLLLCEEAEQAGRYALALERANAERRMIEEETLQEAQGEVDARFDAARHFGLVVGGQGWHVGTIGIVAARLCGRYRRPAVVVAFDEDGVGRGSGRSLEGVDLVAALGECADLLSTFGGHKMAAGLEIERSRFDAFRTRFNEVCTRLTEGQDLGRVRRVDAWISLREADEALLEAMRLLEPTGLGNAAPVWGVRGARLVGARPVGKDREHLRMEVLEGGVRMGAIAFNRGGAEVPAGEDLDILFRLEADTYKGGLQLNVQDFRAGG